MNATNERTAPAWMNLDGYCAPEVREKLANAEARLGELIRPDSEFSQACRQAYEAIVEYERATHGVDIDDAHEVFGRYTGYDVYRQTSDAVATIAACAQGDLNIGTDPDSAPYWYKPWAEQKGLNPGRERRRALNASVARQRPRLPSTTGDRGRCCVRAKRSARSGGRTNGQGRPTLEMAH